MRGGVHRPRLSRLITVGRSRDGPERTVNRPFIIEQEDSPQVNLFFQTNQWISRGRSPRLSDIKYVFKTGQDLVGFQQKTV